MYLRPQFVPGSLRTFLVKGVFADTEQVPWKIENEWDFDSNMRKLLGRVREGEHLGDEGSSRGDRQAGQKSKYCG